MTAENRYVRKMARGGIFALVGKGATYPVGLLLAIILTRVLTPAELGGYFLAMSLILITATLIQFGAGPVMVKFVAAALALGDDGRARQILHYGALWLATTSLVALGTLLSSFGDAILSLLQDAAVLRGTLFWIAILAISYATISFLCEVLRGFSDLGSASLFAEQLLQRLLLLIALVVAYFLDLPIDLLSVFVLMAVASAITTGFGLACVYRKYKKLHSTVASPASPSELFFQAPPFFAMRLNFWLMDTAPIWILGMFQPPEIVALYGVGNMLALIVLAPWTVANTSLGPAVVKLHAENRPKAMRSMLGTVAGISTLGAAGVVFIIVVFGETILSVVFTDALKPAYFTMTILAIGRGISVYFGAPAMLLSMTKHQMTVLRVLLTTGAIGFVIYFLAARFGGIEWVAAAGSALVIVQALILTYFAYRYLGISTISTFRPREWGKIAQQVLNRS